MADLKKRLEKELEALTEELRKELPREIKKARAMGDLRENAEYQSALERQGYVKVRIAQIRKKLSNLSMISLDKIPKDCISLGSKVLILDLDSEEEISYEIVMNDESDPGKGMISIGSPIAKSLLGKRDGDEVQVVTPSGKRRFEILEFQTIHDNEE
ncbi:MAG: transcription elongation factor GreA [Acidobacteriota bacterium]